MPVIAGINGAVYFCGTTETEPGTEKGGFYNWTLNYNNEIFDATNFKDSSGGKQFVASITNWNASADKYFIPADTTGIEGLANTIVKARFFTKYVASPSTGDTAHYYEGDALMTGYSVNTPVDALISGTINFQGRGALTPKVRATAWTTSS